MSSGRQRDLLLSWKGKEADIQNKAKNCFIIVFKTVVRYAYHEICHGMRRWARVLGQAMVIMLLRN